MSPDWRDVSVVRDGTALQLKDSSGGKRTCRYKDLQAQLSLPNWHSGSTLPCFAGASLEHEVLRVQLGGKSFAVALEALQALQAAQAATLVLRNSSLVATCSGPDLGLIRAGAVVVTGQHITWVGPETELGASGIDLSGAVAHDLQGRLLTPGLVDCHTHPLFAGRRAGEFARRARGDHYLDIAREGGGIKATVQPTRSASLEQHVALCARRMERALHWGTTTVEAKSGYDLTVEGELRLLRVAAMVDALQPVDLLPTLLGAHVLPSEFDGDRAGYIRAVCDEMIPRAARGYLAQAVDVYCDEGAFTLEETRVILQRARAEGLAVKAHIGQFADLGGAQLLSELGALSGDHLEQVSSLGIAAMAKAGVVATMLPGACVQLKMDPPPVADFRDAGVRLALASDLNPGTSHSETLAVPMWLATTHFAMTVEEAWLGVTSNAALALGRTDIGRIAPGLRADLVAWDAEEPAEIPYHFGVNLAHTVYKSGQRADCPS